jgi:hypothetical protein
MKTTSRLFVVHCMPQQSSYLTTPARRDRNNDDSINDTIDGQASLSSVLVLLPVLLGCVLLVKPLLYGATDWSMLPYVSGALLCFALAARWLADLRKTPCMSAL